MTREQLDAIRARARSIEANKPRNDVWLFVRQDVPALLAGVERLTSDMVSLESIIAGLERQLDGPRGVRARAERAEAEVERLTAERDTHAAEAERQMHYSVKQHEVAQAAMRGQASAFTRGAEAMREVVIKSVTCHFPTINAGGNCGLCTFCDAALDKHIRALPDPEDK